MFCSTVFLTHCVSLLVDECVVLSLLLHNLTFSCPRSQDDDPVRDCITLEIKVYAYNNNNDNNNNNNSNNNNNNNNNNILIALIPLTHVLRIVNPEYEFRTGEAINHLLFMDDLKLYSKIERVLYSLIQTVRIFSEDIGRQFGIDKCVMLVMKKGKIVNSDGIELSIAKVIKPLEEGVSYKYLGVLEADEVMVNEMKDKVKKEDYRRVRKVLETKLNGGNVFKAINTWAVLVVRYF